MKEIISVMDPNSSSNHYQFGKMQPNPYQKIKNKKSVIITIKKIENNSQQLP
jgi:hypothetical protein